MWASLIRSVYRRNLAKYDLIFRFYSVSSLAQLPLSSDVSDSGSEENYSFPLGNNISSFNHDAHQVFDRRSVVETLNYLKGQPGTALYLITELKNCGFTHDITTYMAIIRFMCYWGMLKGLKFLFLEVIEDKDGAFGFKILDLFEELLKEINAGDGHLFVGAVDALIRAFLWVRRFDDAFEVLVKIQGWFLPSERTCNLFMNMLVEEGEVDVGIAVFEHLKMNGFCPNVYTYGILVKGLCKKGRVKEAADVFKKMEETGIESDKFTFGSYIDGLCSNGNTYSAFMLLKMCRESGSPVDVYAYASVIRGFVRVLKLEDAESVLLDMKQLAIVPDVYCYGALIQGYCKKKNLLKALDIHDDMTSNGIQTNCVIMSSIMQCLYHLGMVSEVVDQFKIAKESGVFLDEISFSIAINALCKQGKMDEAVLLLEEMKSKNMNLDVKHYTTLIKGYCQLKDLQKALNTYNEMTENGLKPDTVIFHALISGFSECNDYEHTMELLDNMVARGLEPTSAIHNIVIDGLWKAGNAGMAQSYFYKLKRKSLDNYVTMMNGYCDSYMAVKAYNRLFLKLSEQEKTELLMAKNCCFKLLSGLCKKGETVKALMLFRRILESENGPSKIMYSILKVAFCRAQDMKMARWVFDTMIERGIRPDVISYTIMIHGYLHVNLLKKAYNIFMDMIQNGIQPDIITYTVLFDGLSKVKRRSTRLENTGEESTLERYLTKMQELVPDVIHYTVLIDHHCKSNNLQRAKFLFDEMIARGLQPDTIAYTSLISGYCSHGFNEAKVLYSKMQWAEVPEDYISKLVLKRVETRVHKTKYPG